MRFFLACAFFLFLLSPAHAQENDSSPPPAPPTGSVILSEAVFSNGTPAASQPILILARSNGSDTIFRLITDSKGKFVLSLGEGDFELDALLDLYATPGIDYASTASIQKGSSTSKLIFYPSGSLSGKVLQGSLPVSGARVWVSCPSSSFDYSRINGGTQVRTGEAGDFLFRALPAGQCQVSSSIDSYAGSSTIAIEHGNSSSVEIALEKKAPANDFTIYIIAGVALLAVAIAAYFYLTAKAASALSPQSHKAYASHQIHAQHTPKPAKKQSPADEEEKGGLDAKSSKAKAVLATLSEREAEIVRFLMKSGGRSKRSTIQLRLLIPKTSLLRNLRSLERKNIVKLTPFGRNLLAELNEPLFK